MGKKYRKKSNTHIGEYAQIAAEDLLCSDDSHIGHIIEEFPGGPLFDFEVHTMSLNDQSIASVQLVINMSARGFGLFLASHPNEEDVQSGILVFADIAETLKELSNQGVRVVTRREQSDFYGVYDSVVLTEDME